MKIRHPGLLQLSSLAGSVLVRGLLGSMTFRYRPLGPNLDPGRHGGLPERYIYAFWHENMILPCRYSRGDTHVLVSQHRDGELIGQVCKHMGCKVVRGSTSRGGIEALWQLVKMGGSGHLGLTPDGPRGPRRKVQPGVVYLASRTGMPIVSIGIGYENPWRLRSWDQFAVPKPWTRSVGITDQPIRVPADADRETIEHYRLRVEQELERLTGIAEEWAGTGVWPGQYRRLPEAAPQDRRAVA